MSGFSAQWLALREAHDRAARSRTVLDALAAAFAGAPAIAVVDLGCGTGSTMRAIAGLLPARQHWRLIDDDEALLAYAAQAAPSGTQVTTVAADLAQHLERAIGEEPDVVTLSALLDLVSAAWIDRLAAAMVRLARPLYAALTYDGAVAMTPATRHDTTVIAAVNHHQLTDKGFGPALGPGAARTAPDCFRRNGFAVVEGRSDWRFGNGDRDIQLEMLAGWAAAAGEIGVARSMLDEWLGERRDHVAAGRSRIRVGHVDFFARPTARR
jgi:ubiquinone/menaquinone biosynthesis C-methylase UbiE